MTDKQYLVQWEIDIYAESPEDAARQALAIQRDNNPANLATVFTVQAFDSNEDGVRVDLIQGGDVDLASHGIRCYQVTTKHADGRERSGLYDASSADEARTMVERDAAGVEPIEIVRVECLD